MFEKILEKLEYLQKDKYVMAPTVCYVLENVKEIVKEVAKKYGNGWISVKDRLPEVETEVLIHARRKFRDGSFKDIVTTAMYEDGTVRENDSCWGWEDIDGEWDEEEECWIVPKGWWENKHYNPDGVLNNEVDDEVIEWMPFPPYQNGEPHEQ